MAVSLPGAEIFSRDVTNSSIRARKRLEGPVYVNAPSEMGLEDEAVLLVVKAL